MKCGSEETERREEARTLCGAQNVRTGRNFWLLLAAWEMLPGDVMPSGQLRVATPSHLFIALQRQFSAEVFLHFPEAAGVRPTRTWIIDSGGIGQLAAGYFPHSESVAGASFLPASHSQPPEAYCMVHAVSTNGVRHFVHRTRIIKQMICPQWSEAFYAAMPEDFDCARLQVSVYGATARALASF
eukprot:Skav234493  [mRNA]  locus=scaffold3731:155737:157858:+ [translate_table: standard]